MNRFDQMNFLLSNLSLLNVRSGTAGQPVTQIKITPVSTSIHDSFEYLTRIKLIQYPVNQAHTALVLPLRVSFSGPVESKTYQATLDKLRSCSLTHLSWILLRS